MGEVVRVSFWEGPDRGVVDQLKLGQASLHEIDQKIKWLERRREETSDQEAIQRIDECLEELQAQKNAINEI